MTFEFFLIACTVLYVSQVVLFLIGLSRLRDNHEGLDQPFVSVVVAARNEEQNLASCIDSITKQTYPSNRYEVIVVNDNSTDRTQEICAEFVSRFQNVKALVAKEEQIIFGKANALAHGIDRAQGEIILITDADCVVPETWIEHTAKRYGPDVGLMGGMTLQDAENNFEGMQSLDWAYLQGLAAAMVALKNPLTTIGNNFSFRRAAYKGVGGYRGVRFSVTEDYALFQAIVRTNQWDYLYPIDSKVLVMSQPCKTWKDLIRQKHRWGSGGREMKFSGYLIMAIGFSLHSVVLTTLIFGKLTTALMSLFVKSLLDFTFLYRVLSKLRRTSLLRYFLAFELYFILYLLALPFLVLFGGKIIWKERSY